MKPKIILILGGTDLKDNQSAFFVDCPVVAIGQIDRTIYDLVLWDSWRSSLEGAKKERVELSATFFFF